MPFYVGQFLLVELERLGPQPWELPGEAHVGVGPADEFNRPVFADFRITVTLCEDKVSDFDGFVIDEELTFTIYLDYSWLND